jgi:hypothetical protein
MMSDLGQEPNGAATPIKDALRQTLERVLETQEAHPVWPRIEVLWGKQHDLGAVFARTGEVIEQLAPEQVVRRVEARRKMIHDEQADPLRWLCEPDIWREIDLAMARKRLDHPGLVLELLCTGGMRPGKTEGCTRRVMANYLWTPQSWIWCLHQTDITGGAVSATRTQPGKRQGKTG